MLSTNGAICSSTQSTRVIYIYIWQGFDKTNRQDLWIEKYKVSSAHCCVAVAKLQVWSNNVLVVPLPGGVDYHWDTYVAIKTTFHVYKIQYYL